MRSVLVPGGIETFVSKREYDFLENFNERPVYKKSLNEQEAEMARQLVGRGVLQRFNDAERGIYFLRNQNKGIQ